MREAAVDLAVDDHRVDDVAAVVHRHEAADLDLAGAAVDVDHADVAAEGEGQVGRVVVVRPLPARPPCPADGWCRRRRRSPGWSSLRAGAPLTKNLPVSQSRSSGRALEQVRGDLLRLVADLARGHGAPPRRRSGSSGWRRCRGRRARCRCRLPRPGRARPGCPAPRRRSARRWSRAPGPATWCRSARWPCRWGGCGSPRESNILMPRMSKCFDGPGADDLGEAADADAHQLARARASPPAPCAAPRSRSCPSPSAARPDSCRCRTPSPAPTCRGTCSGWMKFFMRSSAGIHLQLLRQHVGDALDGVHRLGDAERAAVGDAAGRLVGVDAVHLGEGVLQVVGAGADRRTGRPGTSTDWRRRRRSRGRPAS